MGVVLSADCERARTRVSLGLDEALSQVEQASVRGHLARCAACAEFAGSLDSIAQELRRAPLQRPLHAGVTVRRRSSGRRVLQIGAAAAAVVLAAALGSLAGSLSARQAAHQTAIAVRVVSLTADPAQPRLGARTQQNTPA